MNIRKQMNLWWIDYRKQKVAEHKNERLVSINSAMFFLAKKVKGYELTVFEKYTMLENSKDNFKFVLNHDGYKCHNKNQFFCGTFI